MITLATELSPHVQQHNRHATPGPPGIETLIWCTWCVHSDVFTLMLTDSTRLVLVQLPDCLPGLPSEEEPRMKQERPAGESRVSVTCYSEHSPSIAGLFTCYLPCPYTSDEFIGILRWPDIVLTLSSNCVKPTFTFDDGCRFLDLCIERSEAFPTLNRWFFWVKVYKRLRRIHLRQLVEPQGGSESNSLYSLVEKLLT